MGNKTEPVIISEKTSRTFGEYRFLINEEKTYEYTPGNINLRTPLTKFNNDKCEKALIELNTPVISAAMQAVTGIDMAVALSLEGGIGAIYCSQSIGNQAAMVGSVKRYKAGFQRNVVSISSTASVEEAKGLINKSGYSNIAVTQDGSSNSKFLGVINQNRLKDIAGDEKVSNVMILFTSDSLERIINNLIKTNSKDCTIEVIRAVRDYITYAKSGVSLEEANCILSESMVKFLPIIGKEDILESMVFSKDKERHTNYPFELADDDKRLLASAAINTRDYSERVPELVKAGVNILFIDASNGFSQYSRECLQFMQKHFPHIPIVAGNYITKEGFRHAVENGAWAVKIGMGGGSICITQEQKGTGRGQATALYEIAEERNKYLKETGIYIPLISDGGLVNAKDIAMAYAFGADSVMMGRWFARLKESPTEIEERGGHKLKPYWGEGSMRARNWQRYGQENFEEGVEGYVPFAGDLKSNLIGLMPKIKEAMCDTARKSILDMHKRPVTVEVPSFLSIREGRVHDIIPKDDGSFFSDRLGQYKNNEWSV
ncbi:MAG: IMP dehydrogenase [Candidatus Woesearchaeota archaeon]|nr:IMP dehydrogenase [Candidatus Woesearchaeota archaeon]